MLSRLDSVRELGLGSRIIATQARPAGHAFNPRLLAWRLPHPRIQIPVLACPAERRGSPKVNDFKREILRSRSSVAPSGWNRAARCGVCASGPSDRTLTSPSKQRHGSHGNCYLPFAVVISLVLTAMARNACADARHPEFFSAIARQVKSARVLETIGDSVEVDSAAIGARVLGPAQRGPHSRQLLPVRR